MLKRLAFAACLLASPALAQNCSNYPYTLANGQTADAVQVMANFNAILACANGSLAHNGVNSDITEMLSVTNLAFAPVNSNLTEIDGLTTPLALTEGGTGANNASSARTNLGLGTSAVENLLGTIVDDGSGNLIVGNSGVVAGMYSNATITIGADGRITSATGGASSASPATAGQMEAATNNTNFATPLVMPYAPSAVKAWVTFNDNGGITVISSYNVASVSGSSGTYTVTLSGGLIFSGGGTVCSASGTDNLTCTANGQPSGLNPTLNIFTTNSGGSLTQPTDICTVEVVGNTTN